MTTANLLSVDGKKKSTINLPKCFSEIVRESLIQKIIEAKKVTQPYGPSPVAGNQYSASGVLKHHRKVWKSQYGRGMSRIPRKTMSRKGSQFNWVGATVPNTRGGRRAHPPKSMSMINNARVNKRELRLAIISAISASANAKYLIKRYDTLKGQKIENVPFVVESKLVSLKTKDLIKSLQNILGNLFYLAEKKKSIRNGIGKLRGRKYKKNLGLLIVLGNDEKLKSSLFDVQTVGKLGINDLANGGAGRLVVYTEKAIKDLQTKFATVPKGVPSKEGKEKFK
ncbi:50S ribosomal protein L4 [archaeon]|jgi:large subunit ribosomal protein L4e|nr:50S ribosomal protein L4 [archaeon]